jgi:hypothetical protein
MKHALRRVLEKKSFVLIKKGLLVVIACLGSPHSLTLMLSLKAAKEFLNLNSKQWNVLELWGLGTYLVHGEPMCTEFLNLNSKQWNTFPWGFWLVAQG